MITFSFFQILKNKQNIQLIHLFRYLIIYLLIVCNIVQNVLQLNSKTVQSGDTHERLYMVHNNLY